MNKKQNRKMKVSKMLLRINEMYKRKKNKQHKALIKECIVEKMNEIASYVNILNMKTRVEDFSAVNVAHTNSTPQLIMQEPTLHPSTDLVNSLNHNNGAENV